jgi:hypothetical protein
LRLKQGSCARTTPLSSAWPSHGESVESSPKQLEMDPELLPWEVDILAQTPTKITSPAADQRCCSC